MQLLRLKGPFLSVLSLLAAGARSTLTAVRDGNRVEYGERQNAQRTKGFESAAETSRPALPAPDVDHACAIAALTSTTGRSARTNTCGVLRQGRQLP